MLPVFWIQSVPGEKVMLEVLDVTVRSEVYESYISSSNLEKVVMQKVPLACGTYMISMSYPGGRISKQFIVADY